MNDKSPIRVAQVIGNAVNGGVEAVVNNYYKYIDRNKYQFDFYVDSVSDIIRKEKIEPMGGRVFLTPKYQKHPFGFEKYLLNQFKNEKYLIVHSNMNALSCFVLRAAKKAGVEIRIAHSHSTANKNEALRSAIKNILKLKSKTYATDYLACSELAGRWLFGDKTFNQGQVNVLNNSIDISEFKFDEEKRISSREELHIPNNAFVVGNVGRFVSQKNQSFLINALKEILVKKENSYLLLIGEGPLEKSLKDEAKELGIENRVIFAGAHKHPARFYNAMDIFALPSLYEGLPVSGIEAQVNGLKCLFSDQITKEVDVGDRNAFLSIESLDDWVNTILDVEEEINDIRKNEYQKFVGGDFDIVANAARLETYYDELIRKHRGGSRQKSSVHLKE